jgi:hypothetical protein
MKTAPILFFRALCSLEATLRATANAATFQDFCGRYQEAHPIIAESGPVQWYLEPSTPRDFPECLLHDRFADGRSVDSPQSSGWRWEDPFGDCSYRVQNGLEIRAANGRDLWHINLSAPRWLRTMPDDRDFAVQTICRPVSEDVPVIGGLLLRQDKENYLRLDRGRWGKGEIAFAGCIGDADLIIGRGLLRSRDPEAIAGEVEPAAVWLRLERTGDEVQALCSSNGEEWFRVGTIEFPSEGLLQIGLHAIGHIDRTVYHGAYPDGTAIRFESFTLWGPDR